MSIKCNTCDIQTWKKHLHLNISSNNIDTFVPSLYHASKPTAWKCFDCCISHFCTSVSISSSSVKRLPPSCESLYMTNTFHHKQETFLYECPLHWVLLRTKKGTTEHCSLVVHSSSTDTILTTETNLWTCTCAFATWTVMKRDCAAT
jgi:hypothetical protein